MLNDLGTKREEFFPGVVQQVQQTDHHLVFTCANRAGLKVEILADGLLRFCLLYTSPSPRDRQKSRMPSSA